MSPTPQTNTDLAAVAAMLETCDDVVICGHVSPDGDCLGSQLALAAALRGLGKRVTCVLAKDEPADARLSFLPGYGALVPAARYDGPVQAFVAVDVPTRARIGDAAALLDACETSVVVDHHASETTMADFTYVDPDAASTTVLVWELARLLGANRAGDVAVCCYTGLVTDTGRFQYQNTDAAALRAASEMVEAGADAAAVSRAVFQSRSEASVRLEGVAVGRMRLGAGGSTAISWLSREDFEVLNATKADAEPVVDALRSVAGVRVACMLREQDGGVRGSLRAKDGTDVAAIARRFGGGGHVAAAGFTLELPLSEAVEIVERAIREAVAAAPPFPSAPAALPVSDEGARIS
ncbi:recombinase RecJ [Gordonibacter sp. An230]|uniref:DHH family phosphoesterase n=1 Tax=Gordonibacter sp. An230 TaxID=1965592 RepID=UPI000B3AC9DE|nr:DHH family phosphoesterase [Gordonibacter sp. An230]OUO90314.1 recombinase RecJ [Gordonibacter sp. An230]